MTVINPNSVPAEPLTIVGVGRVEPDLDRPDHVDVGINLSRDANRFEEHFGQKLNLVEGQDYFVASILVGSLAAKVIEFDSLLERIGIAARDLESRYNASIDKIQAEAADINFI